eukprot:ctg_1811.g616
MRGVDGPLTRRGSTGKGLVVDTSRMSRRATVASGTVYIYVEAWPSRRGDSGKATILERCPCCWVAGLVGCSCTTEDALCARSDRCETPSSFERRRGRHVGVATADAGGAPVADAGDFAFARGIPRGHSAERAGAAADVRQMAARRAGPDYACGFFAVIGRGVGGSDCAGAARVRLGFPAPAATGRGAAFRASVVHGTGSAAAADDHRRAGLAARACRVSGRAPHRPPCVRCFPRLHRDGGHSGQVPTGKWGVAAPRWARRIVGVQYALNGMFLIRGSMYAKGTKGSKSERRAQAVLRLAEADEFDADAAAQLDAEVPAFLRTARAVSEGTTDRAVLMQVPEAVFPWHRPAVATASTPVASRKAPSTAASGPDADDALLQEWAAWSSAAGASPSPAGPGYDAASPTLPRHPSPRALADELLMGVSDIDDDPLAELLQKVSGKRAHHAAHAPKHSTGDVRHRERRRHNE